MQDTEVLRSAPLGLQQEGLIRRPIQLVQKCAPHAS
jgi:hypothetical protein